MFQVAPRSSRVHDGSFCFDDFPYTLRHITGQISFGPDPNTPRYDRVAFTNMRGYGLENTRNARNLGIKKATTCTRIIGSFAS